jgi:hypothetical protein
MVDDDGGPTQKEVVEQVGGMMYDATDSETMRLYMLLVVALSTCYNNIFQIQKRWRYGLPNDTWMYSFNNNTMAGGGLGTPTHPTYSVLDESS